MLGEPGVKQAMGTQAAWVRSLLATYVRAWEGQRISVGGLFGAPAKRHGEVLPWSRSQQIAFLIHVGRATRDAVKVSKAAWAQSLRKPPQGELLGTGDDAAFYGNHSLFSTDQGIRGLLYATNDLCYVRADPLKLSNWAISTNASGPDEAAVASALSSLKKQPVAAFIGSIATALAAYDWRTSSAPGLKEDERTMKAALRGSGGYRELRRQLLRHLSHSGGEVAAAAKVVQQALKY
jgi:hypothetical protein